MKTKFAVLAILLILVGQVFGQIEAGDKEVSFLGYFATFIGEDVEANGTGSLQLSYGKYVTKNLVVGIAPTLTFFTGQDEYGDAKIETEISGSIFFNLNLASASKTIPYITGQYYQFTFDIPDEAKFTDYSYVNVGAGVKSFFNEYAAFNTLVTYGFSLAEESSGGILIITTGLSFIF